MTADCLKLFIYNFYRSRGEFDSWCVIRLLLKITIADSQDLERFVYNTFNALHLTRSLKTEKKMKNKTRQ